MSPQKAIIIGAGPAGLTAALELLKKSDIKPVILESTEDMGGISKTVNYRGNRIDIGGHRFFSKSKWVNDWWKELLPVQGSPTLDEILLKLDTTDKYKATIGGPDPEKTDRVMLLRNRLSRIYSAGKFFDYPVTLNLNTIRNLGPEKLLKIASTYIYARLHPIKEERSLEDFFINRFGWELYNTFFRDYSRKVWGVSCNAIKPEWGAQRVKGLSVTKALLHAANKFVQRDARTGKELTVETSLIEQFMYPKYGPGQLWQEAAGRIEAMGGMILKSHKVVSLAADKNRVLSVEADSSEGRKVFPADYFISTMPVRELISGLGTAVPDDVQSIASGLEYRDFITVGLLLREMKLKNKGHTKTLNSIVPDNWIYIQDNHVNLGRLQIFNNWSPYLLDNIYNIWIGLEYFCNEGDALWSMHDADLIAFAANELERIHLIDRENIIDGCAIRIPKAYPAYFGTFEHFDIIRNFTDCFTNLYLVGRNGMHRYNNMDHSMLTAMAAVENIIRGLDMKDNIWSINAEDEYHEG